MLQVIGAFGDQSRGLDETLHRAGSPPDLPPLAACVPRPHSNGTVDIPMMDRIDVRLHPDDGRYQEGKKTGRGEVRGWFSFADGRPIDTLSLLFAADAFPPAVFNLDLPPGWVPTVELTVHVRGVPAPGPLKCRFSTRFVRRAKITIGQPRCSAISRRCPSGLTATGWPTASSIGRSLIESEYA